MNAKRVAILLISVAVLLIIINIANESRKLKGSIGPGFILGKLASFHERHGFYPSTLTNELFMQELRARGFEIEGSPRSNVFYVSPMSLFGDGKVLFRYDYANSNSTPNVIVIYE
jgi:hypothetical protein